MPGKKLLVALALIAAIVLALLPPSPQFFEQPPLASVRVEIAGEGNVLVNGSLVKSGSVLKLKPGSTLAIRLEAPEHAEAELYVNGSKQRTSLEPLFIVRVRGDTTLKAVFKPRLATLHVDAGELSALVAGRGWERQVSGYARLEVEVGEEVSIKVFCVKSGGEILCIERWIAFFNTSTGLQSAVLPPNATIQIPADTVLRAVVAARTKEGVLLLLRGAVSVNGVEAPATIYPNPLEVSSWAAEVDYLGNGTWRINAPKFSSMFLELPGNWASAAVEVWVENNYTSTPRIAVYVVISEQPLQSFRGCSSGGTALVPGTYSRVLLGRGGNVLEMPGGWEKEWGYWPRPNPAAKGGRLYLIVEAARVRLRVAVHP